MTEIEKMAELFFETERLHTAFNDEIAKPDCDVSHANEILDRLEAVFAVLSDKLDNADEQTKADRRYEPLVQCMYWSARVREREGILNELSQSVKKVQ